MEAREIMCRSVGKRHDAHQTPVAVREGGEGIDRHTNVVVSVADQVDVQLGVVAV